MPVSDDLEIDVWQFVRIMVALERKRARRTSGAFAAWRDVWRDLDARLDALGRSDAAAFADLMMRQHVVLPAVRAEHLREALAAIETVTRQMTQAIERGDGGAAHQADLRFERDALSALARRLTKHLSRRTRQRGTDKR